MSLLAVQTYVNKKKISTGQSNSFDPFFFLLPPLFSLGNAFFCFSLSVSTILLVFALVEVHFCL